MKNQLIQNASKLGYKHYGALTVEELNALPLLDDNKQIEYMFLQRWFRNKHKIVFGNYPNQERGWTNNITTVKKCNLLGTAYGKTYEQAQENGLEIALKLIKL